MTSIDIDFPDGTKISMKKEEKQVVVENVSTKQSVNVEKVQTTQKIEEKIEYLQKKTQ